MSIMYSEISCTLTLPSSVAAHGANCVKTKSRCFTRAAWQAKQVSCCVLSAGSLLMNLPKPQPPVAAYFFEFLIITCTVVAAPGTEAGSNSRDGVSFQANLTRIVPSGNGSIFRLYASTATEFPRTTRSSFKGADSRAGAISSHLRYPTGIETP